MIIGIAERFFLDNLQSPEKLYRGTYHGKYVYYLNNKIIFAYNKNRKILRVSKYFIRTYYDNNFDNKHYQELLFQIYNIQIKVGFMHLI